MKTTKDVLIVEDELIVALDFEYQLNLFGYRTFNHAADYDEAVRKIDNIAPDLILLDIMLKDGSSGFKIAHYANQKGIPVIFITASTHPTDYRIAEGYKPAAILHKPVNEDQLRESIEKVLGEHNQL